MYFTSFKKKLRGKKQIHNSQRYKMALKHMKMFNFTHNEKYKLKVC